MDNFIRDREMRLGKALVARHARHMDQDTADDLLEHATDMAYEAFGDAASDEHIEWAFQRLVMHWRWGLPSFDVMTVH